MLQTELFNRIWKQYLLLAPDVKIIYNLLRDANKIDLINDHIALRTFNLPVVSLDKIAAPFIDKGYYYGDEYHFPNRHLFARHLEHKDTTLPKIFISELNVSKLSSAAVTAINHLVDQVNENNSLKEDFCCSGRPWTLGTTTYDALLKESEYAAWVAAHGYQANHFTVSVNHLPIDNSLEKVNQRILEAGFTLNSRGGLIKGSKEVYLEQSSTMAQNITVDFSDGKRCIPSCFYEFARRYPLKNGNLYQGFVTNSADKIFESTHRQTL